MDKFVFIGGFRKSFGRGGGGGKSEGGGKGGGFGSFQNGPPSRVIRLGYYSYSCANEIICKVEISDVPYFNAPIYLENKTQIGKVDEIFGTVRDFSVSIKLMDNMSAESFKPKQEFFIDPARLLPLVRFLPKPPQPPKSKKRKTAGAGGSAAGGIGHRGGSRGGSGNMFRGARNFKAGGNRGNRFGNNEESGFAGRGGGGGGGFGRRGFGRGRGVGFSRGG